MAYYAQLDESGVCYAVTERLDIVEQDDQMVLLPMLDIALLGRRWDGQAWTDPPSGDTPVITRFQFRSRFTDDEKFALYTAAETKVQIRIWLDDLNAAQHVDLTDPRTIAGVMALESAGLIAAGRAAEVLSV